jgi:hypothetical protein
MPKTGESGKERGERVGLKNPKEWYEHRGYGMRPSNVFDRNDPIGKRYEVEDAIERIAKKRASRTGIMAPIQQLDDTYGINELAKQHNKETNPNTRKPYAKGGATKCYARGGGIEIKGKTKGRFV